jgi:hypothetical protein
VAKPAADAAIGATPTDGVDTLAIAAPRAIAKAGCSETYSGTSVTARS